MISIVFDVITWWDGAPIKKWDELVVKIDPLVRVLGPTANARTCHWA